MACDAFPVKIPAGIKTGELDHHKPLKDDNGIQFEPIEEDKEKPNA